MSSEFLFLILIWLLSVYLLFRFVVKQYCYGVKRSSTRDPPSPPGLPIMGHLHHLLSSSAVLPETLRALAVRYNAPLMRLRFGSATAVIVSDVATAKEMLKHNEMNFLSRPDIGSGSSSSYNIYAGSTFIFAEYGEYWRFMKKLCMTELLSVAQVNRFAGIRREEAMKLMETLVLCSDEGKPCDLGFLMLTMTNNVICRMVMSTRCSGTVDESKMVWEIAKEAQDLTLKSLLGNIFSRGPLARLDLFGYGKRLKALLNKFDSLIESIMAEHEHDDVTEPKRKDVLDILLDILHRGDEDADIKLTRTNIKCFLMELFLAGTETTSVALQWAMAELINSPKTFKKLREEIDTVVGSSCRLVEESDVPKITYLQAVVKETLRKHPPAPLLFRKSEKDCKINGYDLLANEKIVFNLRAIMRDPNSWGENSDEFQPERFTGVGNTNSNYDHYQMEIKGKNISLIPFGSGRRGCPGASLTLSVLHAVLGLLVQCFDFKVGGDGRETINMEEASGFSTTMAYPLMCYPVVRLNPFKLPPSQA